MNTCRKRTTLILAVLVPLLGACDGDLPLAAGIMLDIRDARTGAPAAFDATVFVSDSRGFVVEMVASARSAGAPEEYADTHATVATAWGLVGAFDVRVEHPLYRTWHHPKVKVRRGNRLNLFDSPRPKGVHVRVELEPR